MFSYLHRYPAAQLVATAHIIGVVVRCKLQPCYSVSRWRPGDKLRVAQTEQTCGSLPAGPPSAAAHATFPPATNYGLRWASGRCRSPNQTTHALRAPAASQARSHSPAPAQQHWKKPRPAQRWLPPAGRPPAVSQSPTLLPRERAPKQPPRSLSLSPALSSPLRLLPSSHSFSSPLPFYTTTPVRPKASPLSASATRPSWISESRSARSGLFSCLWWR